MKAVVLAAVMLAACARFQSPRPTLEVPASRDLAEADRLARAGSGRAARTLYRRVLREGRGTLVAAEALYGLGRLYVDPESGVRDYGSAHTAFSRLLREYPNSARAPEARCWDALITEMQRNQTEAGRLRADLDRLKALDMEQERSR
jgi:Tetratricopeptide repeat